MPIDGEESTYLDDYITSVESLPNDIRRDFELVCNSISFLAFLLFSARIITNDHLCSLPLLLYIQCTFSLT